MQYARDQARGQASSRSRRRLPLVGLLLPVGVFLLALIAYWPMLKPGWAVAGYDEIMYYYPIRHMLAGAWSQHHWILLWNNQYLMGVPFLANIQAGALYLPNLIYAMLPTAVAMSWSIALHVGLLGAGMYLYARRGLRLPPPAAIVTALTFMLSGFVTAHSVHLTMADTFGWAPWLMLAADRTMVRPTAARAAAIAGLVALSLLAGNTNATYFDLLLAAGAGLAKLAPLVRRRDLRAAGLGVAVSVGGIALGFGIASAQVLPTLELVRHGFRSSGLTLQQAANSPLPVRQALANLLPDYVNRQATELSASVGAAPLALAALAVAARWRRPRVWLLCLVALVAVITALGLRGRIYELFFYGLPGFRFFRIPSRAVLLSTVPEAILAGYGTQVALQLVRAARRPRWRRRAVAIVSVAAALTAIPVLVVAADWAFGQAGNGLWSFLPRQEAGINAILLAAFAGGALLIVVGATARGGRVPCLAAGLTLPLLVAVDLVLAGNPTFVGEALPAAIYHFGGPGRALVQPSLNHRYLSLASADIPVPPPGEIGRLGLDAGRRQVVEGYLQHIAALTPNVTMGEDRLSPGGYEESVMPLHEYIAFRHPLLPPGSANQPTYWDALLTDRVWDPSWLAESGTAVVLTSQGFDPNPPGCRCLIETASDGPITAWRPAGAQPSRAWVVAGSARTSADIRFDSGDRVSIRLPRGPAGDLVLADSYYPGWTASVDGVSVPIRRFDGMLRAVRVPAGAATVVFTYRPASFVAGAALSLLALFITASLAVAPRLGRWAPWKRSDRG